MLHLQVFDVSLEVGLQVQFLGRGIHAALPEVLDHALHLAFPLHLLHCEGVVVLLELLERLQQIQVLIALSLLLDLEVLVDLFDLALVLPADLEHPLGESLLVGFFEGRLVVGQRQLVGLFHLVHLALQGVVL